MAGAWPELSLQDSLDGAAEALSVMEISTDPSPELDRDDEDGANDDAAQPNGGGHFGASRLRLSAVHGPRTDHSLRACLRRHLCGGIRTTANEKLAYLELSDLGIIRTLLVGRLRARMGERLILGRGLGFYPSPNQYTPNAGPKPGFRTVGSLSKWFSVPGVALDTNIQLLRLQGVAVADRGAPIRPRALWLTVEGAWRMSRAGLTVAGQRTEPSGKLVVPSIIDVHGAHTGDLFGVSFEVARLPNAVPFVFGRLSSGKRPRCSVSFHRAPVFPTIAQPIRKLEPPPRISRGAVFSMEGWRRKVKVASWVSVGRIRSDSNRRTYRRVGLELRNRVRGLVGWKLSARYHTDLKLTYPRRPLDDSGVFDVRRYSRFEGTLRLRGSGAWSHRFGLRLVDIEGEGTGVIVSVDSHLELRWLDAAWRISTHSLPPGVPEFISRPGPGPFELLSAVYGGGSDVAIRIRFNLTGQLRVLGYYGSPWHKERRVYVGAEVWSGAS